MFVFGGGENRSSPLLREVFPRENQQQTSPGIRCIFAKPTKRSARLCLFDEPIKLLILFFSFIVLVLVVCNHFKVKRKSLKLFIIKSFLM